MKHKVCKRSAILFTIFHVYPSVHVNEMSFYINNHISCLFLPSDMTEQRTGGRTCCMQQITFTAEKYIGLATPYVINKT